jgi:NAD(P)-dependent dehydrogenase (short-subunit alcohol dehydrogenase family)
MKSLLDDCNSIEIGADVSKEDDCIKLVAETVKHFGRIDIFVDNAGVQEDVPLTEVNIDEWYNIISVDLTGPFVCSREAVKQMQKDIQKGEIPTKESRYLITIITAEFSFRLKYSKTKIPQNKEFPVRHNSKRLSNA